MQTFPPADSPTIPAVPASFGEIFFTLEPGNHQHGNWWENEERKVIFIDQIAEQVYGKAYNSLRGCEQDTVNLPNDSYAIFRMADEDVYEETLEYFDSPEIYLGYNPSTQESVVKTGMTPLEYWLSIKIDPTPGAATVDPNPLKYTDLENAVFEEAFYADRVFTPSLQGVIADLIRRGILPKANYIFDHSW